MDQDISATELQFFECFEVEPKLLDPTGPWCYNDALYIVVINGFEVSFAVAPAYADVRIIVRHENRRIFEFQSMQVRDVRVVDLPGIDAVEVDIAEQSWLRLQLRPHFEITQGFAIPPEPRGI